MVPATACIADEREPAALQGPTDEPVDTRWSPRDSEDDLDAALALERATPEPSTFEREDPRPLPHLSPTELEASLSLIEQELGADLDDMADAELLLREASLLLARDDDGDRKSAMKTLNELVSSPRYQSFIRLDDAWFYLAYEAGRAGDTETLQRASLELIRRFPASRWIPEAYVLFGDHYFAQGETDNAAKFYEKVASGFPGSATGLYAEYRWAACLATHEPTQALERLVRVIRDSERHTGATADRIRDAARRDVPRAYARVGKASKAVPFFTRFGEDRAPAMLDDLVVAYEELGDSKAAHVICEHMRRDGVPTHACTIRD
jgi:tetratricopeptide (TPR) repeat protein